MRLEYLKYLLEVNRCGSITQSADNLCITQPALSNAIKNIETELGYTIFKRSQKGVLPTARGLKIIQDAEQICEITSSWKTEDNKVKNIHGSVTFAAVPAFNKAFFVDILLNLNLQYPNLKLLLKEVERKSLYSHLQNSITNIGCDMYLDHVSSEEREYNHSAYHAEPLLKDYFIVLINKNSPFADKEILSPDDLKSVPFATYTNQADPVYTTFCNAYNIKGTYFLDSSNIITQMVANNLAFSLAPKFAVMNDPNVKNGEVLIRKLENLFIPFTYYCIYPKGNILSKEEKLFIDFLHEYFYQLDEKYC